VSIQAGTPLSASHAAVASGRPDIPLPNFFLVGAPKAGTTSLYHYLDQHPQIYMSPVKEPHYFAEEIRFANFTEEFQRKAAPQLKAFREYLQGPMSTRFSAGPVEDWADYVKLFQRVDGQTAIGEASVCYLWSKTAAHNIARHCPEARIVMVLRDPVARAYSGHLHTLTVADSRMSFRAQVDAALSSPHMRIGELYPFLEFGLYYEQVRRYLDLFPRERVGIFFYDDYVRDGTGFLQGIFRFLQVDPDFAPDVSAKYTQPRVPRSYFARRLLRRLGAWQLARALAPPAIRPLLNQAIFQPREVLRIDPADRARLVAFYREDIENLAELLGRDLSAWLRT
jgi:hypothetical protein